MKSYYKAMEIVCTLEDFINPKYTHYLVCGRYYKNSHRPNRVKTTKETLDNYNRKLRKKAKTYNANRKKNRGHKD